MPAKGTYHLKPTGVGLLLTQTGGSVSAQMSADYHFIHLYASSDCHIKFGKTAPTATATVASLFIKAETPYVFPIDPSGYIATIASAGTIQCHYME